MNIYEEIRPNFRSFFFFFFNLIRHLERQFSVDKKTRELGTLLTYLWNIVYQRLYQQQYTNYNVKHNVFKKTAFQN